MKSGEKRQTSRTTRVMERELRRLLEHPYLFPIAGLCLALMIALPAHRDSMRTELQILAASGVFTIWLPFWVAQRAKDPGGRGWLTITLAVAGANSEGLRTAQLPAARAPTRGPITSCKG